MHHASVAARRLTCSPFSFEFLQLAGCHSDSPVLSIPPRSCSLVLRLLVCETLACPVMKLIRYASAHDFLVIYSRREFSQFVSDHVLCYLQAVIHLPVVYLENEPNEVRKDCRTPRLCLDRRSSLARFGSHYREPSHIVSNCRGGKGVCGATDGTM